MLKYLLIFCFYSFSLTACMHRPVVAYNYSGGEKKVIVRLPFSVQLPPQPPTLQAWDLTHTKNEITSRDRHRYPVRIPFEADTAHHGFFFNLKPHHHVTVLQYALSPKAIKQTLFIAGGDTLRFRKRNGCWVYYLR